MIKRLLILLICISVVAGMVVATEVKLACPNSVNVGSTFDCKLTFDNPTGFMSVSGTIDLPTILQDNIVFTEVPTSTFKGEYIPASGIFSVDDFQGLVGATSLNVAKLTLTTSTVGTGKIIRIMNLEVSDLNADVMNLDNYIVTSNSFDVISGVAPECTLATDCGVSTTQVSCTQGQSCITTTSFSCVQNKCISQSGSGICQPCPYGCDVQSGKCEAAPAVNPKCLGKQNSVYCDGTNMITCVGGQVDDSSHCQYGCVLAAGECNAPPANVNPLCAGKQNSVYCDGTNMITCVGGQVDDSSHCQYGCVLAAGECNAPPQVDPQLEQVNSCLEQIKIKLLDQTLNKLEKVSAIAGILVSCI
jgi:hypothetical protein